MKKNTIIFSVLVVILVIFFSTKVFSQKFTLLHEYDFRETNWGMSKEEVRLAERRNPDYETDNGLVYKVIIDKYDCIAFITF